MAEFWLHYIGSKLYPISRFEHEARRLGVQRTIPFHQLKNFRWGTPILLAVHIPSKNGGEGQAEVFGYFVVSGLTTSFSLEGLPIRMRKVSEGGHTESRACGSYTVGASYAVEEDLPEICEKIANYCKERAIDPNAYKWFLKGEYHRLEYGVILNPAKFARGYMKVKIKGAEGLDKLLSTAETPTAIYICDYKRRQYLPKREAQGLDGRKLDEFLG